MVKTITLTSDIPEYIYSEIPDLVYISWKKHFDGLNRYAEKLATNKYKKPEPGDLVKIRLTSHVYYLSKSEDDLCNIVYKIKFRIIPSKFNEIISDFLKKKGYSFDFSLLRDKDTLLFDIELAMRELFHKQFRIDYDNFYINVAIKAINKDPVVIRDV